MLSHLTAEETLEVAPLSINKLGPNDVPTTHATSPLTPLTPATSAADIPSQPMHHFPPPISPVEVRQPAEVENAESPVFHCFLRAVYHFHPSFARTDSSITLPLNEGDVILVHSIHTNGWADGTLLGTGARGWLPTNFCDVYDPDEMRNLLLALLDFWDLLRSTPLEESEVFSNQEFMKSIIAGVRYLLERTNCLTRESTQIVTNDGLRRGRKFILSELSSLVKTAKRLQEVLSEGPPANTDVINVVDDLILKAFKMVLRGVRFLDVYEHVLRSRASVMAILPTVTEETSPQPPPAQPRVHWRNDVVVTRSLPHATDEGPQHATEVLLSNPTETAQSVLSKAKRLSNIYAASRPSSGSLSQSPRSVSQTSRPASVISHRLSLAGPSALIPFNLASERLHKSHDAFLSYLSSFIGRLHLQSHSRLEVAQAIRQSATSGAELLIVIDAVCAHNLHSTDLLSYARTAVLDRVQELVLAGRQILRNSHDADIILSPDHSLLRTAATGCVKAAGDCVAKTKWVIERIGDFELASDPANLGIDLSGLDAAVSELRDSKHDCWNLHGFSMPSTFSAPSSRSSSSTVANTAIVVASPALNVRRNVLNRTGSLIDKPLPDVPHSESDSVPTSPNNSRPPSSSLDGSVCSSMTTSFASLKLTLPPLPRLSTTLLSIQDLSQFGHLSGADDLDLHISTSFDSTISSTGSAGSAGSANTSLSRDSELSLLSQASTRATTPDISISASRHQASFSGLSNATTLIDEVDEVESTLMEKTFAHELKFNKEGQVTAGSLPALVERLTTHESTPDAMFVSAFYLTFRLFSTASDLAQALVNRFDHVRDSAYIAGPVRLRVYNAFKIWLESHWRDDTDRKALRIIVLFAEDKLSAAIPSAGRRLLELAQRVSNEGALVPRLVSSMVKPNAITSGSHAPADSPAPPPTLSKSQFNALHQWRLGGISPSILDFDPLELARQLTIKQMGIFCAIRPEELLSSEWMTKAGVKSPNVKAMSSLSTDLSNLVAETILQHSEVKKRAAIVKQWIKIAESCLKLHNYDGLISIVCSLNNSTIGRLRKTWEAVSQKKRDLFVHMQAIMEPTQNCKVLRTRLHDHVPPCLPFLGMYLTDLTFVDIGNPATKQLHSASCPVNGVEEGSLGGLSVINFDKHFRTAKIIMELQRFQIPYRLTEVPELQKWMSVQISRARESEQGNSQINFYRRSLLLEPRESTGKTAGDPLSATSAPRGDLFGWMSRDRGSGSVTPA